MFVKEPLPCMFMSNLLITFITEDPSIARQKSERSSRRMRLSVNTVASTLLTLQSSESLMQLIEATKEAA